MARQPAPPPGAQNSQRLALEAIREEAVSVLRLLLALAAVGAVVAILFVWLRMEMFILAIPAGSIATTLGLAGLMLLVIAFTSCFHYLSNWLLVTLGGRLSRRLTVPACIAAADGGGSVGERSALALNDINELNRCLSGVVGTTLIQFALIPAYLATLLLLHWIFLAVAVVAVATAAVTSIVLERTLRGDLAAINTLRVRNASSIADAANNAEAVEAHGMLPAMVHGWTGEIHDLESRMIRTERITRLGAAITKALSLCTRGAVMGLSVALAGSSVSIGGYMVFSLVIINVVMQPFTHIAHFLNEFAEARSAWQRLQALAGLPRRRAMADSGYSAPVGRLVVERLTVMLPGMVRPLLREVNLVVGPGDVVGIAGNVGSGKSTLLRAVMGIIRPTAGGCYLDGHATWQWDRVDIARHVGFLPQDPGLSDGTVAEAIARLDRPNMAMVIEAATRAGAHQTIVGLPQGYATPLTETMLSSGQRQRIALARAIFGRPRLVVLDEPSSWLDAEGLAQLIRLLAILKADGCGVLFTSHNLDLVDAADHVLAMRAGVLGSRRPANQAALPAPALARTQ